MSEPTPELVRALWAHMHAVYGSTRANKADSAAMQLAGDALSLFGVVDKTAFMSTYTTTIGTTIFTPFELGVDSYAFPLWAQMMTAAHEHQHVHQWQTEGVNFAGTYLVSPARRAAYEAEAYRCNVELNHWRYGALADPAYFAGKLAHYGCGPAEVAEANQILTLSEGTIAAGGIVSHAAATAIAWLNANAPGLRKSVAGTVAGSI